MKKLLLLAIILFSSISMSFAVVDTPNRTSIAVIPDSINNQINPYYVYSVAPEMFSNDIGNALKIRKRYRVVLMPDVKNAAEKLKLEKNLSLALEEYKHNYNINFVKLRPITMALRTNYVLLVTSNIDTQTYVMKGTVWNLLNVPGADVVNPTYLVTSNISLLDMNNETVIWRKTFQKKLNARDFGIIPTGYSPNSEQLAALKKYSNHLSFEVANFVEENINPQMFIDKTGRMVHPNSIVNRTKYHTAEVYNNYIGAEMPNPKRAVYHCKRIKNKTVNGAKKLKSKTTKYTKKTIQTVNNKTKNISNNVKKNVKNIKDNINIQDNSTEKELFRVKEVQKPDGTWQLIEEEIPREEIDNYYYTINPKRDYVYDNDIKVIPTNDMPNARGNIVRPEDVDIEDL